MTDWPGPLPELYAPPWAADTVRLERFRRYIQTAVTPRQGARLLRMSLTSDISEALPLVQAPTLVIHPRDLTLVPADAVRAFSDLIPGASLREIPGDSAVLLSLGVELIADIFEECRYLARATAPTSRIGDGAVHRPGRLHPARRALGGPSLACSTDTSPQRAPPSRPTAVRPSRRPATARWPSSTGPARAGAVRHRYISDARPRPQHPHRTAHRRSRTHQRRRRRTRRPPRRPHHEPRAGPGEILADAPSATSSSAANWASPTAANTNSKASRSAGRSTRRSVQQSPPRPPPIQGKETPTAEPRLASVQPHVARWSTLSCASVSGPLAVRCVQRELAIRPGIQAADDAAVWQVATFIERKRAHPQGDTRSRSSSSAGASPWSENLRSTRRDHDPKEQR